MQARYPGVQAVSFAAAVEPFELRRFEADVERGARASRSPYPRFAVRSRGRRSRYLAISHVEPVAGNQAAFGPDLLSERRRRVAAEATETTGRPAATAPIRLVQERGREKAFLIQVAVRDRSGRLADPRAGRLLGVATLAVRVPDLVTDALERRKEEFDLEIHDVGGTEGLPASASSPRRPGGCFDPFHQADPSDSRVYGGTGLGLAILQAAGRADGGARSTRGAVPAGGAPSRSASRSRPRPATPAPRPGRGRGPRRRSRATTPSGRSSWSGKTARSTAG